MLTCVGDKANVSGISDVFCKASFTLTLALAPEKPCRGELVDLQTLVKSLADNENGI